LISKLPESQPDEGSLRVGHLKSIANDLLKQTMQEV